MLESFFSLIVLSQRWNMLDDNTVTAKTINGFKSKLEKERAKKMGLFMDWRLLDPKALTVIPERPSCKYPASKYTAHPYRIH